MTTNLETQAENQLAAFEAAVTAANTELADAQDALRWRHPDPDTVAVGDWRDQFGAEQYLERAVERERSLRGDEQRIRSELALIPTPADHDPLVLALGSNLAEQAEARVVLRDAREIVARAEDVVAAAAAALARASASLERADGWVASATARQRQIEQLATELAAGDLATVVADATIARGAAVEPGPYAAGRARLPAALLTRSGERYAEAAAVVEAAAAIVSAAQLERDELAKLARPMVAAVDVADRTLDSATTRLHDYVTGAVAALARAQAQLTSVANLGPLTPAEIAALDAADPARAAAVAAVALETTFSAKLAAYAEKDRDVTIAVLAALADDADRDPNTVAEVTTAIAARDDPAIKGELDTARTAYDGTAESELSVWEQAAPVWLWEAALAFHDASATLARLSSAAERTALVDAVGDATDDVAKARDDQAELERATNRITAELEAAAGQTESGDAHRQRARRLVRPWRRTGRSPCRRTVRPSAWR